MDDKHKLIFNVTAAAMVINAIYLFADKQLFSAPDHDDNTRQIVPIGLAALTIITRDDRFLILNALQSVPTLAEILVYKRNTLFRL